jgi:hypothetical protein
MKVLSHEAASHVKKARKAAPFLSKSKGFPSQNLLDHDMLKARVAAWRAFLKQFEVVRLNYDGVSIADVMAWYDAVLPPFDLGEKRKEFPDAFAIASMAEYAKRNACYVAVVSNDNDFKKACVRFPSLMHFQSLPDLTELLLSTEDGRIADLRDVLARNLDKIGEKVLEEATDLFFHSEYSDIVESDVNELTIMDLRVVALGQRDCTITFDAKIKVDLTVTWMDVHSDDRQEERHETVRREFEISGTAKVTFDAKTNALLDVPFVALNQQEIEATRMPPMWPSW